MSAAVDHHHEMKRHFNVLRYGAVGDDKTDNTDAFSACLKAIVEAGGGRMYLPEGVYRGRLIIPGSAKWITVEIAGEGEPTPVFGTIGSFPMQNHGTIVKCLAGSGDAIISAQNLPEKMYMEFSGVYVIIRNLDVRTHDNPGIGGIDLQYAVQCKLENMNINTGTYNVQASKPTHGTSGLITPACDNGAWTVLRNVVVTGYHNGIVVNEHTDGDSIVVASCVNGLNFMQAHHASRFARVGTYRNTHHITVSGRHGFSIEQMNTEQPGPGQTDANNAWQTLVSDVNDPKNLGVGDINYWVVIGNKGAADTFTKNGGASIRARRIGSASAGIASTGTRMMRNSGEADQPAKVVRLVLPQEPGPALATIGRVFAGQVQRRCEVRVAAEGRAPLTVELAVSPGIGVEGYRIEDWQPGGVRIVGNDERGVLYGVGKFLRESRYDKGGFTPGAWRGTSVPEKSLRGIYFATHFYNYYQTAPVEELEQYVEELALWGVNTVTVWYDMHHFRGFADPEAVALRGRLECILRAARRLGLSVGLMVVGNEAYADSPLELRADRGALRGGFYDEAVCPSKPGGLAYTLRILGELFDWVRPFQPEYVCIWPYDQGGCGCAKCMPWGSNGFLKCAEPVADLARRTLPGVKIILSTWYFDAAEWQAVAHRLQERRGLADVLLMEHFQGGSQAPVESAAALDIPVIGFPEISMAGMWPWGGFGANPQPERFDGIWQGVRKSLAGGLPYSEGIFEDINKALWAQMYWDSSRPADDILKEYIAYEYAPDVTDEVLKIMQTLEQNHHSRWWPGELDGVKLTMDWFPTRGCKPQADPGAEEAYALARRVDSRLPERARRAWRWRVLFIRAMLDAHLKETGGAPRDLSGFEELQRIYFTTAQSDPGVRPPIPLGSAVEDRSGGEERRRR